MSSRPSLVVVAVLPIAVLATACVVVHVALVSIQMGRT
jgi:hypothetical protein